MSREGTSYFGVLLAASAAATPASAPRPSIHMVSAVAIANRGAEPALISITRSELVKFVVAAE
jgi:hypothetical protein